MNLTVLSFSCALINSNSPMFVGNHLSMINSHFKLITSVLFFNQQHLLLRNSEFSKGTGEIIYNKQENQDLNTIIANQSFTQNNQFVCDKSKAHSISVINCQFTNIESEKAIYIDWEKISIYITRSVFISCIRASNGVIMLNRARSLTMTHVCTNECGGDGESGVLNYDCMDEDFSFCLYNTFVNSRTSNGDNSFNIYIRSGNQFYRCNNLTVTNKGGFHFSAPQCFSFAMTTAMKCGGSCFQFSGYQNAENCAFDKTIEMVNFFSSHKYLFKLSGECAFKLTILNSVLLNSDKDAQFFSKGVFF